LGFLTRIARQYGDVTWFRLGRRPCILINHPDLIENVLVKNNRNFIKPFAFQFTRPVLGNGLLTSEGEFWKRQRRLAAGAFRGDRISGYGPDMVAATVRMLDTWQDGQTRDIHADMMQVTLDIVATTLFGADVTDQSHEIDESLRSVLRAFGASFNRMAPLPSWFPMLGKRRARAAVRGLNGVVQRLIDERRRDSQPRNDLLSMMLNARDEDDGSQMTDLQLADEARTFLLAGHETTALTLSWSFYLLANHPQAQAQLQTELQSVLGDRLPEVADIPRLKFAEQIVLEAMRLYPPAFMIGREPLADCELGGYTIPAGTTIFMSPWVMHHDERFYERPERFEPERWVGERAAALPKMAYFPFGGGPRICIGNTFAMMESVLLLTTIVQGWSLRLVADHPIKLSPVLTLRPRYGIKVVVSKRPQGSAAAEVGGTTQYLQAGAPCSRSHEHGTQPPANT
jgi:cytochrome P450